MNKGTIYVSQEEVSRLQEIAKWLGLIAERGAAAPLGGGSASELVRAIANLPESRFPLLAELLEIDRQDIINSYRPQISDVEVRKVDGEGIIVINNIPLLGTEEFKGFKVIDAIALRGREITGKKNYGEIRQVITEFLERPPLNI
jgi:hypothetical protein